MYRYCRKVASWNRILLSVDWVYILYALILQSHTVFLCLHRCWRWYGMLLLLLLLLLLLPLRQIDFNGFPTEDMKAVDQPEISDLTCIIQTYFRSRSYPVRGLSRLLTYCCFFIYAKINFCIEFFQSCWEHRAINIVWQQFEFTHRHGIPIK